MIITFNNKKINIERNKLSYDELDRLVREEFELEDYYAYSKGKPIKEGDSFSGGVLVSRKLNGVQ